MLMITRLLETLAIWHVDRYCRICLLYTDAPPARANVYLRLKSPARRGQFMRRACAQQRVDLQKLSPMCIHHSVACCG